MYVKVQFTTQGCQTLQIEQMSIYTLMITKRARQLQERSGWAARKVGCDTCYGAASTHNNFWISEVRRFRISEIVREQK